MKREPSIRTTLTMQASVFRMAEKAMTEGKFRSISLYLEDLVKRENASPIRGLRSKAFSTSRTENILEP